MSRAITSGIQGALMMGGMFSFMLAGVRLHIDQRRETAYMEVEPQHERWALKEIAMIADSLGFELMPEFECPAEELPSGALRHWLAEKEVVRDICSIQAV